MSQEQYTNKNKKYTKKNFYKLYITKFRDFCQHLLQREKPIISEILNRKYSARL